MEVWRWLGTNLMEGWRWLGTKGWMWLETNLMEGWRWLGANLMEGWRWLGTNLMDGMEVVGKLHLLHLLLPSLDEGQVLHHGHTSLLGQEACFSVAHPAVDATTTTVQPQDVFVPKVLCKRVNKDRR